MANEVSDVLKRAIYAGSTERVFIALLKVSDGARGVIRLTSDGRSTTHNGEVYESRPFRVTLPEDLDSKHPQAQLTISNLDEALVAILRTITDPATVTLSIVLDSDPDTVERGPWTMELIDVSYDADVMRGTITAPSLTLEPFPGHTYNTEDYAGL